MENYSEKSNERYISMENLSKSELLQIIYKQNENVNKLIKLNSELIKRMKQPVPAPRIKTMERPIPAPHTKIMERPILPKNVKQMVKEYEENIIAPVPPSRAKIKQVNKALKGFTKSYEVNIIDEKDPLVQLQKKKTKTRILY